MITGNEKGSIKPIICIILLIASVYVGYKFSLPYYRYYALKSETKSVARLSFEGPDRYRTLVYEKALTLNIPIKPSDIQVVASKRRVQISTSWSEEVDLLGYYQVPLKFELFVEQ